MRSEHEKEILIVTMRDNHPQEWTKESRAKN